MYPQSSMLALLAGVLLASTLQSAEIRLRSHARPDGNLVRLGDVADIDAAGPDETGVLAEITLMPAPAPAAKRFVRLAEIKQTLERHGVVLTDHHFYGASVVTISEPAAREEPTPASAEQRLLPAGQPMSSQQWRQHVEQSIAAYLETAAQIEAQWSVDARLSPQQEQMLAQSQGLIRVDGGRAPWVGPQQFDLHFETAAGSQHLGISAQVRMVHNMIVAKRELPRGVMVRERDLEFRETEVHSIGHASQKVFRRIDQVVGQETTRAVAAGQPLSERYLRRPLLVRRGDPVTVYARSGGIRVRTTARATQDGARGDVITVETLLRPRRKRFDARVVDPQVVEVWAGAVPVETQARSPRPSGTSLRHIDTLPLPVRR